MKPVHEHDSDCCTYLKTVTGAGRWDCYSDLDLYVCTASASPLGPTYIARYSSDGPDYLSMNERSLTVMCRDSSMSAELDTYPLYLAMMGAKLTLIVEDDYTVGGRV